MDEMNEMSQAKNNEQHLQELRQRINAKAEELVKKPFKYGIYHGYKPKHWATIAFKVILAAVLVLIEVISYNGNYFWAFNSWFFCSLIVGLILFYIMHLIMRHLFTKMKNASTASQHYKAVKRLMASQKLRLWLPLVLAFLCAEALIYFRIIDFGLMSMQNPGTIAMLLGITIGTIFGASIHNWYIDDLPDDVEELGNYVREMKETV